MGRKPIWKDFYITTGREFRQLQSYYESSKGAWAKYTVVFHGGLGSIETNLPYTELRRWFRYALDRPIPDHVSGAQPTWEMYP
jgi:hypothetical protein